MLSFMTDYQTGGHPKVMSSLCDSDTNLQAVPGYGSDPFTAVAAGKIIHHFFPTPEENPGFAHCPSVYFLAGGTMTNSLALDALLSKVGGVICADTGHINGHEAGTIERFGHKCIALPSRDGKLNLETVSNYLRANYNDDSRYHCVLPEVIYLSQPTELGTFYTLAELTEFRRICDNYSGLRLYVDGARLCTAICDFSRVERLAMFSLFDAFSVGGTKCGALFGEALVFRDSVPQFFTLMKQHGALMAKGRVISRQFSALFTDGLYEEIGKHEMRMAQLLKSTFLRNGLPLYVNSPSNQQFVILTRQQADFLRAYVQFEKWADLDDHRIAARFVTAWSTSEKEIEELDGYLQQLPVCND